MALFRALWVGSQKQTTQKQHAISTNSQLGVDRATDGIRAKYSSVFLCIPLNSLSLTGAVFILPRCGHAVDPVLL
jgi:hypothetical protein